MKNVTIRLSRRAEVLFFNIFLALIIKSCEEKIAGEESQTVGT